MTYYLVDASAVWHPPAQRRLSPRSLSPAVRSPTRPPTPVHS